MIAADLIKEPFLAIFETNPGSLFPTSPSIFSGCRGVSRTKLKQEIGSLIFTRNLGVFEIADIEFTPSSEIGTFRNFFEKWYKLKVHINKLDWSFEETKSFLLKAIEKEMHGYEHMLDTERSFTEIKELADQATSLSEIIDLVLQCPKEECLTTF